MKKFEDQKLFFDGNQAIFDEFGQPIMMEWETGWMLESAKIVCENGGRILNIGFGLGIIDNFIQSYPITSHTICESHPDIINKMKQNGWFDKPNVNILHGRWQDVLYNENIQGFDGIYFDAYYIANPNFAGGEGFIDKFIPLLPKLLNKGGVFSFWPGRILESSRGPDIQFRNNLMKALEPLFYLEKKHFNFSDDNLSSKKRLKINNYKSLTIPVITYRNIPLEKTLF